MAKDELNVTNMFGSDDQTSILPKSEPKKLTTEDLFSGEGMAKAGSDRALAEYVGQEELGTAGLEDVVTRGRITAADTMNEKSLRKHTLKVIWYLFPEQIHRKEY